MTSWSFSGTSLSPTEKFLLTRVCVCCLYSEYTRSNVCILGNLPTVGLMVKLRLVVVDILYVEVDQHRGWLTGTTFVRGQYGQREQVILQQRGVPFLPSSFSLIVRLKSSINYLLSINWNSLYTCIHLIYIGWHFISSFLGFTHFI